jgi:hypothetical protein
MNSTLLGAAVVCGFVIACGGSNSSNDVAGGWGDAASEAANGGSVGGFGGSSGSGSSSGAGGGSGSGSSSGGGSDAGVGSCGSCTSDSQCQSACAPVSGGGTNCCDFGSGLCYATTSASCSVWVDAGGGG